MSHVSNNTRVHPNVLAWDGKRYTFLRVAGEGAYGVVEIFQTVSKNAQYPRVALKSIPTTDVGVCPSAVREMCCLSMLHHPCVVQLLDVIHIVGYTVLYLEYMSVTLSYYLQNIKDQQHHLSLRMVQNYSRQLLQALHYCHSRGVIHRDVKPANLLLSRGNFLKLADFGMAQIPNDDFRLSTDVVTIWYRAPELLFSKERYTTKVDLWAAGCIIAEMYLGLVLFSGKDPIRVWDKMTTMLGPVTDQATGRRLCVTASEESPLKKKQLVQDGVFNSFILGLLQYDPKRRYSARKALQDTFFSTDY